MIKTQIQIPNELYYQAKVLAHCTEMSLAEVCRRGLEYMIATHPAATEHKHAWKLPKPLSLGKPKIAVEHWRSLAHENNITK